MIEHGSDIHQGGDGPLMRAAMNDDRIPMMELLVAHAADVDAVWNGYYPIICAPCECLAPGALKWLLEHGANPRVVSTKYGSPLSMVVGTYARASKGNTNVSRFLLLRDLSCRRRLAWHSTVAASICSKSISIAIPAC